VAFLGPISRVYIAMPDGSVINAQISGSSAKALAPGDRVTLGVDQGEVLVVAA
jgi:putative spermidine/putrescine transport system ATP-binding protein